MQFLTISRRKDSAAAPASLTAEESRCAQAFYAEGSIRQIWHRDDLPGACILWEAANETEVRERVEQFPFARAELIELSIIPLRPYGGFIVGEQTNGPSRELPERLPENWSQLSSDELP